MVNISGTIRNVTVQTLVGDETSHASRESALLSIQRPFDRGYVTNWEPEFEVGAVKFVLRVRWYSCLYELPQQNILPDRSSTCVRWLENLESRRSRSAVVESVSGQLERGLYLFSWCRLETTPHSPLLSRLLPFSPLPSLPLPPPCVFQPGFPDMEAYARSKFPQLRAQRQPPPGNRGALRPSRPAGSC